ncbi:MAG: hypothetical protein KGQ42_03510, partial [Alphaproteobacteria bacterium]|nr:hypothetical protein [Alphaproteobacteria bacterium]
ERVAAAPNNRIGSLFETVEDVVGMTNRVIEIRLKTPRPSLLQLLAQPELGVRHNGQGTGPFAQSGPSKAAITLKRINLPDTSAEDDGTVTQVTLDMLAAEQAVARFKAGKEQAVLGGTLADYHIMRAANIRATRFIADPVQGVFGFMFTATGRLGDDAQMRQAMNMVVDRDALTRMLNLPGWQARTTILPARLDTGSDPAIPDWATAPLDTRLALAPPIVSAWRARHLNDNLIRIAMPKTGLWRVVYARLRADWRTIGLDVQRVDPGAAADLVLIDEVAPDSSANWYFARLGCHAGTPCDTASEQTLDDARAADTLDTRAAAFTRADQAYTLNAPAIILGNPFRWALTSAQTPGLHANPFALHPLTHLR